MNLTVLAKNLVLMSSLNLCQVVAAQEDLDYSTPIDSLVQHFIDQNSVVLTPSEAAGVYIYSTGFWLESIVLKENGRFRVVGSKQLDKSLAKRGTWRVHENKVVLRGRTGEEQIVYIVKYNKNICLLTSGIIAEWKAIEKEMEATGEKLVYNPFRGKVSLYKRAE